jgi:hypothetical protein
VFPTVSIDTPLPDGYSLLPGNDHYSFEQLWGQPSITEEDMPQFQVDESR